MSASSTTLRLITVLFLLAGILLLRKPVLGQTKVTSPQIRCHILSQSYRDPGSPMRALAHWGGIGWGIRAGRRKPHCYLAAVKF